MFDREFAISLMQMHSAFLDWSRSQGRDDKVSILVQGGFQLDNMRNNLVKQALDNNQDYVLFLDTDMIFPQDTIIRMIEDFEDNQDQELEVVAGLSVMKEPPYVPVIFPRFDKEKGLFERAAYFPVDRLFQIEGVGMACTMIKTDVFKRMEEPYFKFKDKDVEDDDIDTPNGISEDLYFCLKAGPFIICDPRIQTQHLTKVGHNLDSYVKHNELEKTETDVTGTAEQLKKMKE